MMDARFQQQLIAVTGHRGGSMKSTVAAGLATRLAALGHRTVLADLALAGGSFALESDLLGQPEAHESSSGIRMKARRHTQLPMMALHCPAALRSQEFRRDPTVLTSEIEADVIIADLPAIGAQELEAMLTPADLVLLTIPSTTLSLRSLLPFLRRVQEIRAMPGREFDVLGLMTGTALRTEERIAVDQFVERHLAPFLSGAHIPWDEECRSIVSEAQSPDALKQDNPVSTNLDLLAKEVAKRVFAAGKVGAA